MEHFFRVTTGILLETVDKIIEIVEKQEGLHEKSVISVDGKVSCGSGRRDTIEGKGDYVLALKGKQHLFYEEARDFFSEEIRKSLREKKKWLKAVFRIKNRL